MQALSKIIWNTPDTFHCGGKKDQNQDMLNRTGLTVTRHTDSQQKVLQVSSGLAFDAVLDIRAIDLPVGVKHCRRGDTCVATLLVGFTQRKIAYSSPAQSNALGRRSYQMLTFPQMLYTPVANNFN